MGKGLLAGLLVAALWAVPVLAGDAAVPAQVSRVAVAEGFSVTIPQGWRQIDKKSVAEFLAVARKNMNGMKVPDYCFAIEQEDLPDFCYPYMLAYRSKTGWIPERELKNTFLLEKGIQKGMEDVRAKSDALDALAVDKPSYDAAKKIIWTRFTFQHPEAGVVLGLQASMLTADGMMSFACYNVESKFDATKKVFLSMLDTVEIKPELQYEKGRRGIFHINHEEVVRSGVFWGVIGGLFGGLYGLYAASRRKRKALDAEEKVGG